jgi:hypothetical protein
VSILHVAWALEQRTKTPSEKLVLICLAEAANVETGECWPAQTTIARRCQVARTTVNRTLASLEEAGLIEQERRAGAAGETLPSVYRLPVLQGVSKTDTPCLKTGLVRATGKSPPNVPLEKSSRAKPGLTYAEWSASLPEGQRAMPASDPIFAYADRAGIPLDFLRLAWLEFRRKHLESGGKDKRQKDWRQTFRNYVEGNYLKLWFLDGGEYRLTTVGAQAQKLHGAG